MGITIRFYERTGSRSYHWGFGFGVRGISDAAIARSAAEAIIKGSPEGVASGGSSKYGAIMR